MLQCIQFCPKASEQLSAILGKKKGPYGPLLMVGTLQTPLQSSQLLWTRRGWGKEDQLHLQLRLKL